MNSFIYLALFVAVAVAVPVDPSKDAYTVKQVQDNGIDSYNYEFQTSDGKTVAESGQLKNIGTENEAIEVRGQFSYTAPDGQVYTVSYIANEDGFQPQAAHLPVPPSL